VIVAIESHQGVIDMQVTTIGLDIAKNVFSCAARSRVSLVVGEPPWATKYRFSTVGWEGEARQVEL
jgi:hypothetical protein